MIQGFEDEYQTQEQVAIYPGVIDLGVHKRPLRAR